jgi:hypothetical protein
MFEFILSCLDIQIQSLLLGIYTHFYNEKEKEPKQHDSLLRV